MSDRKYRQRGYQDSPREPRREEKPAEKKEYAPRGQPPIAPKTFNMPGFREVVRCARCGNELTVAVAWGADSTCAVGQSPPPAGRTLRSPGTALRPEGRPRHRAASRRRRVSFR